MIEITEQGEENCVQALAQQERSESKKEEALSAVVEESPPLPTCQGAGMPVCETAYRPLTRTELRTLWMKQYGELDLALHMWARLVEQQDLEIEIMLQMQGLLVFGVMVSTLSYAEFYMDLNEALHREREPETADALRGYYLALIPPRDQPEIGSEGLPVVSNYVHMHDVTIMNAG